MPPLVLTRQGPRPSRSASGRPAPPDRTASPVRRGSILHAACPYHNLETQGGVSNLETRGGVSSEVGILFESPAHMNENMRR